MGLKTTILQASKNLTTSLNRYLLGNLVDIEQIYEYINKNYDIVYEKVKKIEEQIINFNNTKPKFFVDINSIFYLVLIKHIKFVEDIINTVIENLEFGYDIVETYTYVIKQLYENYYKNSISLFFNNFEEMMVPYIQTNLDIYILEK